MLDLVARMGELGHDVHVIYSPERADDRFYRGLERSRPASALQCSMERGLSLADIASGMRLRRLVEGLAPLDVLHAHSSKAGLLTRIFCRRLATGMVYSPHGFYSLVPGSHSVFATAERLLSTVSDRIIAVSASEASHAREIGIKPVKVVTVPNGVEAWTGPNRQALRQKLGIAAEKFVVGFVGRFDEQKDPLLALQVAGELQPDGGYLTFMIGDGPLEERARSMVAASALASEVVLAGHQDARSIIPMFDCLLCTSRYEGMPVAFLEALSAGVPIITPDVGGALELVGSGVTGYVTERTASCLADGVRAIRSATAEVVAARSAGCRALAAAFSTTRTSDLTLDVYASINGMRNVGGVR